MCKSKAEGGQRCASHGRDLVTRAKDRYERSGTPEGLQEMIVAWIEYASTSEGYSKAKDMAAAGEAGPGGLPSEYWTRIAGNGAALRDRNDMIAQAVSAAKKHGDAFHKAAATTWPPLPKSIRSQAALDSFLDEEERQLSFERTQSAWKRGRVAAARELTTLVDAMVSDPHAVPGSLAPRTEQEKQEWQDYLGTEDREIQLERSHGTHWEDSHLEGKEPITGQPWCVAPLAAFGRDHSLDPAIPLTSRDRGFVGRLRDADGNLTDSAYLVTDTADTHVTAQVIDLHEDRTDPDDPAWRSRYGIQVKDLTMTVRPEALERAEGPVWDRFAGRRPRFTFENSSAVVLDSPADQTAFAFAHFRRANTAKPGMAPKGFLRKLVGG